MSARRVYSSKQLGFISFLKDLGSVIAAEPRSIENAIRCGGLAPKKTVYIKNILSRLQNERGRLSFEYLCGLLVEEISKASGWVPKTADRNKTYGHLNRRIPYELKFDLNCLLYILQAL
ncbi:hypothetical protein YC2023_071086 [Brassica napus]